MAEPVSSVVTLVTVSLAIIKEVAIFLDEARTVDSLIARLVKKLTTLEHWITVVDEVYKHAARPEGESSKFVHDVLTQCHNRLCEVEVMVARLSSRSSGTFLKKVALKIKMDRSRRPIEQAIEDVQWLIERIHQGISLHNLHLTSLITSSITEIPIEVEKISHGWSDDLTLNGDNRRTSEEWGSTFQEPFTTHTILFDTQTPQLELFELPIRATEASQSYGDWVDFKFQVTGGNDSCLGAIKTGLSKHPESYNLVNSVDKLNRSPLHFAAQRGDIQLAQILLDFSANINAVDSQPSSILDLAVANNQEEFVAFLLDNGVDQSKISDENRSRLDEIQDALELRKFNAAKAERKARKRTRTRWTT